MKIKAPTCEATIQDFPGHCLVSRIIPTSPYASLFAKNTKLVRSVGEAAIKHCICIVSPIEIRLATPRQDVYPSDVRPEN